MAENRYRSARNRFYGSVPYRRWDDKPLHAGDDPSSLYDDTWEREQWQRQRWRPSEQQGLPDDRSAAARGMGRAPKGYRRSDERIREDICERIMMHADIDAGDVSIEVASGRVVLDGVVQERWMKHAIEDIADRCHGVEDIDNRVRVARNAGERGAASDSMEASAGSSGGSGAVTSLGTDSAGGNASAGSFSSSGIGGRSE